MLASPALWGQDIHFSQFFNSPQNIGPALIGVFDGHQRYVANYREQWRSVPVPYLTFSGAYDRKIRIDGLEDGFIGVGLHLNYDRAGDSEMSWTQIGLSGAYVDQLSEQHAISAGVRVMYGQRAFQPDLLSFNSQFNGDIFDSSLPTLEDFANTSTNFFDLGVGVGWFFDKEDSRTKTYISLNYGHILEPTVAFFEQDTEAKLPGLLSVANRSVIQLSDKVDFDFFNFFQFQQAYRSYTSGLGATYHLNQERRKELAIMGALGYRFGDALIAYTQLFYKDWVVGVSYDINTSDFTRATNGNGGPELSVQYILKIVEPPKVIKPCPIF